MKVLKIIAKIVTAIFALYGVVGAVMTVIALHKSSEKTEIGSAIIWSAILD